MRLQRPNLEAKLNANETDQQACNINVAVCAMLRKHFIPWPCPIAGHERTKSRGEAHGGSELNKGTRGAHRADKVWRRGQSGRKADTRRTHHGQGLKARPKRLGGHEADTWRTSSGDAARAYRGQFFS